MKLSCAALATAFALAAAPALAAISCQEPGAPPPGKDFPARPVLPPGVSPEIVHECTPAGLHTALPLECGRPPASTYLKALDTWTAQATLFHTQTQNWRIGADRYAACVEAALQLTTPKPAGAP